MTTRTGWCCLTCERRQSTRGRLRCDCQKGTGCLLPYTAHIQILWPDNAAHTYTQHRRQKPGLQRSSSVCCTTIINNKIKLCRRLKQAMSRQQHLCFTYELTSQSSLMCLANVVWISVREQLSLPLEMSIKSWSEYMSSFSTKCCRSCNWERQKKKKQKADLFTVQHTMEAYSARGRHTALLRSYSPTNTNID